MTISLVSRLGLVIAFVVAAGGCGSAPSSSFLGDTSRFGADPRLEHALVYRHPSRSARDFRKVWLDTIEVQFANPSDAKEVDVAGMKEFIAFWRRETEAQLKVTHELASSPGEGTLRMRMALTRVLPAKPGQMFTPITTPTRLDLATATPTFCGPPPGAPSGSPVTLIMPPMPWIMKS